MQHRALGKTGLMVSEIGYGCEHLEGKPFAVVDAVINAALDGGINIMDAFMAQPQVRTNIGRALGGRRADVYLQGHIGATMDNGQYLRTRDVEKCDAYVKDFLARIGTDYIDLGMIHFVDTEADYAEAFESPYIDYVQRLKKEGVIHHIGVSTHDAGIGMKMVNTGIIDVVMFSVNPAFDLNPAMDLDMLFQGVKLSSLEMDPTRAAFYHLCAAKGVGITVMKALGAGRLLTAESSSLGYALTLPQCIAYSLDRPAVASVLLGAQTVQEVEQALAYAHTTPEERDYASAMQNGLPLLGGRCMYCNHCLPCPQGIDVAAVTKFLDMAKASDNEMARIHYEQLSAHGGDCIECGSCQSNCPFAIGVIENMREAKAIFGK